MLKIVSTEQIREIDRLAITEYGIPETILMENAGLKAISFLEDTYGSLKGKRIAVFCGKGNNGGDGFVIARHLHVLGVDVAAYLLAEKSSLKGNALLNMEIFVNSGGRMKEFLSDTDLKKHKIAIRHADVIIDAILGTGIKSELSGMHKTAVEKINQWKRFCLSVDIPSGLCSDRGAVYGLHVMADATVTFAFPKKGMIFYPAAEAVGKMKAVNISFPPSLLENSPCEAFLLDRESAREMLPAPKPASHKGSFGHAVITGGSSGMGGAVALASVAALRAGAGLSTAAVYSELSEKFELGIPEVMTFPLGKGTYSEEEALKLLEFLEGKSSLLIGPGMGKGEKHGKFIEKVLCSAEVPLVIDADGLNNISPFPEILLKSKGPTIITPHPGEMARLTGLTTAEINSDRLEAAKSFSKKFNCTTVLKGAMTVIASPEGEAWVNPTGNPNLATGGTGDVLAGLIAGLLAKGLKPSEASCAATFIHGLAADIYSEESNPYSMTASDLLEFIPTALAELNSDHIR